MLVVLKSWYKKYFSHPEAVILLFFLLASFGLIVTMGGILAPVIISLIIVYLLDRWVRDLVARKVPHSIAYLAVYFAFLLLFIMAILILLPLLWRQISNLFADLPNMLRTAQQALVDFSEKYPVYFSQEQLDTLLASMLGYIQEWAKNKVPSSLAYIPGIIAWLVYLFLIPLLVFFFLKDSDVIINWLAKFFPRNRKVLRTIFQEMDNQMGNYIRGKVIEITIIGLVCLLVFSLFGLNYSILLAFLVGISVIIPYVGAIVVTIPVALVGYWQWGLDWQLFYMLAAYLVVQVLDGNLLVPILFSKALNLHPVAIIIAILFFGSFWGVWGVVFAIPLATLIKTVLLVWPTYTFRKVR
jgi:putative permease